MTISAALRLSPEVSRVSATLLGMARRADPERIYIAHRLGLAERLVREAHLGAATAERWICAWESEARQRRLDARTLSWWEPAWNWIREQRNG
ncbi:MAG: hypothetical protein ACRDGI_02120 [Candidatus Limnocylindrales bacterium]